MRPAAVLVLLLGCDHSEPAASAQPRSTPLDPWQVVDEGALRQEIQAALARAREQDKQVLLEFVANWCSDCREVVRVSELPPAAPVLASRYERVFVNVGHFDRHRELIAQYQIDRIAALVVLDGQGRRVAKTTLEPISQGRALTPEALAAWLREPADRDVMPRRSAPAKGQIFPPEVVE